MRLKRSKGTNWSILATGKPVSGLTNPVSVVVQVGDDVATKSVTATFT